MKLGEIIARTREEQNISQKELATMLSIEGVQVTNQAISKWENGSTIPNALQFLALCKLLGISDIYNTFIGGKPKTDYERLNSEGKQKANEYIDLLIRSGMYTNFPAKPKIIPLRTLPLYHISVSAGTGQFLDSDNFDMIEVGDDVPSAADFGVRIAGDSMEPRFANGQIVWVHQQESIENGDIGIFLLNDDAYCKKLKYTADGIQLISLNPAYEPIQINEASDLRVFGKVVG